ncbi:hypothetical protein AAHE18_15G231000 [Arachis hypogaea]
MMAPLVVLLSVIPDAGHGVQEEGVSSGPSFAALKKKACFCGTSLMASRMNASIAILLSAIQLESLDEERQHFK